MKTPFTVKKWQLLRWRAKEERVDLSDSDFIAVGKRVFYKDRFAEEVLLPATASAIKTEAFAGCRRLYRVALSGAGNVGISRRAFRGCKRLRELENAHMLSIIGDFAFDGCARLPAFAFGRDLRKIGEYAFRRCDSMTSILLPSCVELIGRGAFFGCTELESVAMEDGLAALSRDVFRDCISLREVAFSSALREIPIGAFRGCSALTELIVPSQITRIGKRAFASCARLSDVTVELGTVHIGAKAFADNPRLKTVFLPHSVKRLGLGAFGLGFCRDEDKIVISVDNEYMKKRIRRQLFLCLSFGRAKVTVIGKSIEERKRERRRSTVEQTPTHLIEYGFGRGRTLERRVTFEKVTLLSKPLHPSKPFQKKQKRPSAICGRSLLFSKKPLA